jgi:hypothetical protein
MPFIRNYNEAMKILTSIGNGKCKGSCKTSWVGNLRYALKTKTNPLNLNKKQRKSMTKKLQQVSGRNAINEYSKTLKKYKNRNSPPYPANQNCNKTMTGNDGEKYISKPNKNNICTWKKINKKQSKNKTKKRISRNNKKHSKTLKI